MLALDDGSTDSALKWKGCQSERSGLREEFLADSARDLSTHTAPSAIKRVQGAKSSKHTGLSCLLIAVQRRVLRGTNLQSIRQVFVEDITGCAFKTLRPCA
jgi:hypothetical protein